MASIFIDVYHIPHPSPPLTKPGLSYGLKAWWMVNASPTPSSLVLERFMWLSPHVIGKYGETDIGTCIRTKILQTTLLSGVNSSECNGIFKTRALIEREDVIICMTLYSLFCLLLKARLNLKRKCIRLVLCLTITSRGIWTQNLLGKGSAIALKRISRGTGILWIPLYCSRCIEPIHQSTC